MLNKVQLIGNLGQDPELRYTQGGASVCNFSVATTSYYKNDKDERQESTEWHRIVVWGKQAESCSKYLKKGSKAYVEGRIQTREWEDKDGNKRLNTEVVANNVVFLDPKSADGGSAAPSRPSGGGGGKSGDDLPF